MVKLGILLFILFAIALYSALELLDLIQTTNDMFVIFGVKLVFFFSMLVIFRYLALLFFSTLQIILSSKKEFGYVKPTKKVSLILPAYNEEAVIIPSLKGMLEQTYPNYEIIVMDDGSTDRTYELAKAFEFEEGERSLRVLTKKNGGKSRALNYAIERAKGELIMSCDADSKLSPDAIELMVRHFEDPTIGAVAGSVYVSNRVNIWTKLQALEYIQGLNMVRNGQAFLKLVNIIPGPIGMFRKDAIEKVGLYEHDTFAEDCDLTLRLIQAGYKIDFEPEALSVTEAPEELLSLIKQRYRWTRGILQAIKKHRDYLWSFKDNPSMTIVAWYMLFEGVIWPFMDFWANLFIIYLALLGGVNQLLVFWWLLFVVLDVAGAIYCLLVTKEDLSLAWYALFYRLFFIGVVNMGKMFSTIEEWFNIKMSWGKLDRKGAI